VVIDAAEARLERLLVAASTDPAHVPEFLTTLLDATVIVPGTLNSVDDSGGRTANLAPLLGSDGAPVQPFFTSVDRLNETIAAIPGYESRYLALGCRSLWEMTRGSTLLLNPHSTYGKEFLPSEIGQLLDGSALLTPRVVESGTRVMVGQPAHVPSGMEDALSAVFGHHRAIQSAYLGWKVTPDSGDLSYLLVIVGPDDTRTEVGDELGRALIYFSQSHPVDVLFARPGEHHLLSSIDPFYIKRRRLPFRR
jgi:SseB protein N-terminal domain/SseB protein C-terminal domain